MLLGVGGGLGGGYWLFEFTGAPKALVIGARHRWHLSHLFLLPLCERLGVPTTLHETGGARAAASHLDAALAAGRRPIAWVDAAGLPYMMVPPQWERCWIQVVGVRGRDPGTGDVLLDDRAPEPWPIPAEQFAQARKSIAWNKQRLIVPQPPAEPLTIERLRAAIVDGIKVGVSELLEPPIKNFGLPAFAKWASLVANKRQKKGWPTAFAEPVELFRALCGAYHGIETNGTGGGAFRTIYAEFLDESADVVGRPALAEAAATYREIGQKWSALAAAALPDRDPLLRRARDLAVEKERLFTEQGPRALGRLGEIAAALAALDVEASSGLSLTSAEIDDLLLDLRERLLALVAAEERASAHLGAAVA